MFSSSKFDVGNCHLINTKIPLSSDTVKYWEPERKIRTEEFQQVETLINELLEHNIIAPVDQTTHFFPVTSRTPPKLPKILGDMRTKRGMQHVLLST